MARLLIALCAFLVVGGIAGLLWCAGLLFSHPGALHARNPLLQFYGGAFTGMLVLGVGVGAAVWGLVCRRGAALRGERIAPACDPTKRMRKAAADLRASDIAERGLPPERAIAPGETRWAIYDRPTRTLWFGGPSTKTHLTVAEESGLLRNDSDYYRPGPTAKMCGGYVICAMDGAFSFDGFSGTFPGTSAAVSEAEEALREWCEARNLPWRRHAAADPEGGPPGRG